MILKSTVNEELAMRNAIVIELLGKFYLIWRLMNYKVLYIKYITFTKQFFFLMSLNILMYIMYLEWINFHSGFNFANMGHFKFFAEI